jgi:hypothetical protein
MGVKTISQNKGRTKTEGVILNRVLRRIFGPKTKEIIRA